MKKEPEINQFTGMSEQDIADLVTDDMVIVRDRYGQASHILSDDAYEDDGVVIDEYGRRTFAPSAEELEDFERNVRELSEDEALEQ